MRLSLKERKFICLETFSLPSSSLLKIKVTISAILVLHHPTSGYSEYNSTLKLTYSEIAEIHVSGIIKR